MAPRLIDCLELRAKLDSYFRHDFPEVQGLTHIRKRADLARALGVADGDLKNLLDGRNDGRADRLRPIQLDWLSSQLSLATEARLDRDQAYDLWRHRTARDFARQLRPQISTDIMSILNTKAATLSVRVGVAPPSDGLQIFEEPFSPLPGEQCLNIGDEVRFEVGARADRCLVILASSPVSWFWMSPSEQHAGPTSGGTELVPAAGGYKIGDKGPHKVVAIELVSQTPPYF